MDKNRTIYKSKDHIHIWVLPSYKNRIKLGSIWRYYSECEICHKLIPDLIIDRGEV